MKRLHTMVGAVALLAVTAAAGAPPGLAPKPKASSADELLQAAIDGKDLAGIQANWTKGYVFNPMRPKVAVALFDLDVEVLANLLLADNCFAGCEDLKVIDETYGTERVVAAMKKLLGAHSFALPGDNIIAQKIGGYLIEHKAFNKEVCGAYVKILEKTEMTYGPLGQLGDAKCNVPKKTLTHFLTSDDEEERRIAAWVAGETKAKDVKPLLKKLVASDGYLDDRTLKYPVREAAAIALNKIENR